MYDFSELPNLPEMNPEASIHTPVLVNGADLTQFEAEGVYTLGVGNRAWTVLTTAHTMGLVDLTFGTQPESANAYHNNAGALGDLHMSSLQEAMQLVEQKHAAGMAVTRILGAAAAETTVRFLHDYANKSDKSQAA